MYRELLDICWAEGSLPTDEKTLRNISLFTEKEFRRCWQKVREQFSLSNNRYRHRKVDQRRNELIGFHKQQQEHGRKGGKKSWEVRSKPSSTASSETEASLKPSPTPSPTPTPSKPAAPLPPAAALPAASWPEAKKLKPESEDGRTALGNTWPDNLPFESQRHIRECLRNASGRIKNSANPAAYERKIIDAELAAMRKHA